MIVRASGDDGRPMEPLHPYDFDRITAAVGPLPRVAYEAMHVYPLSVPNFTPNPEVARPRPQDPLKLYVHIPFCNYACTFCFYAKRVNVPHPQMARYVNGLARELAYVEPGTRLDQLYLGGGTPTVLPPVLLDEVLATIRGRLCVTPNASLTVECSPESVTDEHVRVLRARGIGRVSLGIETLDERILAVIDRRHTRAQALAACELLIDSGFTVNVDLIYAFPGQSEESFRTDLAAAAACGPQSFTLYDLRLNERTPIAKVVDEMDRLDLPRLMRWRALVKRSAKEHGYVQTRWHTFVRENAPPSSYDRAPCVDGYGFGRQLGIGVSAVSHLGHMLYRNHEGLEGYLRRVEGGRSPVEGIFALGLEDLKTLLLVRTLGDGQTLTRAAYEGAFACSIDDDFGEVLRALRGAELIAEDAGTLSLTDTGRLIYDLVTLAFYPAQARRCLAERQAALSGGSTPSGRAPRPSDVSPFA